MLEEFLADQGDWEQVIPGVRACLFSLESASPSLPLQLAPLHFEVFFCLAGTITLTWSTVKIVTVSSQQVLLLADLAHVTRAKVGTPLEGILVTVDARSARESLEAICTLLGGLTLDTGWIRQWMSAKGGCAVEGPTDWSQAAFVNLNHLPPSERGRWCVWKSVELLYLLCNPREHNKHTVPPPDQDISHILAETCRYMDAHLDEPLTIPILSRRACLSATTFKGGFRRLYGIPVHTWLRQRRMAHAAELLRNSSLSVLGVAQSVGYGSSSQFTAAFRQQYGMAPATYRKMSKPA